MVYEGVCQAILYAVGLNSINIQQSQWYVLFQLLYFKVIFWSFSLLQKIFVDIYG